MPGVSVSDVLIPSEDGQELYQFTSSGRHLRTLDALTGAVLYQFAYDAAGRLTQIKDGDGNITTVERDAAGNPTAIVAPFGQRTTLAVDANGYLAKVTSPAGQAVQFTSTADGLLTQRTDPGGGVHNFSYDSLGRLARDEGPDGNFTTLDRTDGAKTTPSRRPPRRACPRPTRCSTSRPAASSGRPRTTATVATPWARP